MGNKFTSRLLGELCHEITVGFVGSMTNEYIENGIPFLRSKNIDEYDVKWDDMKYVSPEFHKKLSKSALKPGDVAIVRTGKPGTTCVIPNYLSEANCSDIVIARVNDELLCPHYLSYFMNAMAHGQVNAHVVGAVQQHFNVGSAKKIEIPLPSRIMQAEIVKILKALDDKLKLNRQINQTLEQMAQTLFKSWFVDFDPVIDNALDAGFFEQDLAFSEELLRRVEVRKAARENSNFKSLPGDIRKLFSAAFEECTEPSLGLDGWVPEGWKTITLSEISEISSGKRPPTKGTIKTKEEPVPVWGGNGIKWFTDRPLSVDRYIITGRVGTLGTVYKVDGSSWASDNALTIRPCCSEYFEFVYQVLSHFDINSLNSGSTQPLVTQTALSNIQFPFPDNNRLLLEYQNNIDSYDNKIFTITKESEVLTNLRDTLLPKLISGELSLSDIKIDSVDDALA